MISNLRRLAADHAALHGSQLPPYYLLPPDDGRLAPADDLSQLTVLLTGPPGTPYSQGLWKLNLKIPEDYPRSPPKAAFRTRIWHPNVEELTGAVCVDTLKRDWQSKLTLRDVLITISCLLIHPNPDSALNPESGTLLREDYEAFAHQAKLMTSIHAPIPPDQQSAVHEAKYRGEDANLIPPETKNNDSVRACIRPRTKAIPSKRRTRKTTPTQQSPPTPTSDDEAMGDSENDDPTAASKENNPSLSRTPVRQPPSSPRKNAFGKRPLSILAMPYPEDPDADMMLIDSDINIHTMDTTDAPSISPSEQNINANTLRPRVAVSPQRKIPKLAPARGGPVPPSPGWIRDDVQIYEDIPDRTSTNFSRRLSGDEKENRGLGGTMGSHTFTRKQQRETEAGVAATASASGSGQLVSAQKVPLHGSNAAARVAKKFLSGVRKGPALKAKARIGVRRL